MGLSVKDIMTNPTLELEDLEGIFHYEHKNQVPENILKYWAQRHNFFSKYDEGIVLTDEAWFAVTPEPIANKIAEHIAEAAPKEKTIIIDVFAGIGANAIAFAQSGRWEQIFAIEKDPKVLRCAKHNAELYGVDKKIFWIQGDCFTEIKRRFSALGKKVVIFGSPPWGGPEYIADEVFDLSKMQPYSLNDIYTGFSKTTKEMVLYLPRSSNLNQLAKYAPEDRTLPVTHYCIKGASKALCAYLGDFNFPTDPTTS